MKLEKLYSEPAQACKQSKIDCALGELSNSIDCLEKIQSLLLERLQPIRTPLPVKEGDMKQCERQSTSIVTSRIVEFSARIRSLISQLDEVKSELDI